ncbi:MAG: SgrR family transcriptional regulator, partial [Clostridia bacterium]|nr:SgrR family transcriptional regulator [Clostridia bacterium]
MPKTRLPPKAGVVKSAVSSRPDVLHHLPRSCNKVWDLLQLEGEGARVTTSLRELAQALRLSPSQVCQALRRLETAGLICWERKPGRGHRSRITLLAPGTLPAPSPYRSLNESNSSDPHPPT